MIIIDFLYIAQWLTPPAHRTVEVIGSIKAMLTPLGTLKNSFYAFFNEIEYKTTWNGQVCMLEELLNREFDPIDKTIYITDAVNLDKLYLFNTEENNEATYVYNTEELEQPTYLYNSIEVTAYDFIVNVPAAVVFNEDLLKFFVNTYKIAGKRWKIKIV